MKNEGLRNGRYYMPGLVDVDVPHRIHVNGLQLVSMEDVQSTAEI